MSMDESIVKVSEQVLMNGRPIGNLSVPFSLGVLNREINEL